MKLVLRRTRESAVMQAWEKECWEKIAGLDSQSLSLTFGLAFLPDQRIHL